MKIIKKAVKLELILLFSFIFIILLTSLLYVASSDSTHIDN